MIFKLIRKYICDQTDVCITLQLKPYKVIFALNALSVRGTCFNMSKRVDNAGNVSCYRLNLSYIVFGLIKKHIKNHFLEGNVVL